LGVSLVIAILVTRGSAGGGAPVGVISPEPILPEATVMAAE
jgi:hypothetical protein